MTVVISCETITQCHMKWNIYNSTYNLRKLHKKYLQTAIQSSIQLTQSCNAKAKIKADLLSCTCTYITVLATM